MEDSRSRYRSWTRSPPPRREDRYRNRSPRRASSRSPDQKLTRSPRSRSTHSQTRRHSRSPRRIYRPSPARRSPRSRNGLSPRRRPSRSPERRPSRSPPRRRDENRPRRGGGGFKWKQKGRDEDRHEREDHRGLDRGYRDHERRRPRSPFRDGGREQRTAEQPTERPKKKNDKEAIPIMAPVGEPMIIVNINDRLGTKAAIPCLASDPIKLFKAQVAARIGREPHEIMLKRQGERPFKDHLTLEDYGVSNGVQLDLELDTGD